MFAQSSSIIISVHAILECMEVFLARRYNISVYFSALPNELLLSWHGKAGLRSYRDFVGFVHAQLNGSAPFSLHALSRRKGSHQPKQSFRLLLPTGRQATAFFPSLGSSNNRERLNQSE